VAHVIQVDAAAHSISSDDWHA